MLQKHTYYMLSRIKAPACYKNIKQRDPLYF